MIHHHHHHFWQAPLRVHSTERRHQSPEWTVLSQVNCVVYIEVAGFQILLNGFHPCNTRTSQWSRPVSCGEAVKICFAFVSTGIRAMCPNRDRRLNWTMAERWGCLVNLLISSLCTIETAIQREGKCSVHMTVIIHQSQNAKI